MDIEKIKSIIESILFVNGEPIKISRLAKIVGIKKEEIENAIMLLLGDYSEKRGLVIIRKEDELQMGTNPNNAQYLNDLIKSEIQENLSKAALEVLSIVAYRGPLTRMDMEAIRGVNCSFTLRTLLMRGLVERIDNPADSRSFIYKISFDFLKKLGLSRVEDLPDFETLSKDERIDSIIK